MTAPPPIFIGIVLKKDTEQVILASFNPSRDQCIKDCGERFPGSPAHIMEMFQDPATVRERLFQFLAYNGVPDEEFQNIMKLIAEGISNMVHDDVDEDEVI